MLMFTLQLKKLRTMLMMNIQSTPNFPQQLKDLSISFLDILKELRSQVSLPLEPLISAF